MNGQFGFTMKKRLQDGERTHPSFPAMASRHYQYHNDHASDVWPGRPAHLHVSNFVVRVRGNSGNWFIRGCYNRWKL